LVKSKEKTKFIIKKYYKENFLINFTIGLPKAKIN